MTVRGWKRSRANLPERDAQTSRLFEATVLPTSGMTSAPMLLADPSALINPSVQQGLSFDGGLTDYDSFNVWIIDGKLQPRGKLKEVFNTDTYFSEGAPNGAITRWALDGSRDVLITSKLSAYHLDVSNATYTPLTYASGVSNLPPSGSEIDAFFGDSVYLPRTDENLAVFTNGVDPLFVWQGSDFTAYSTLTQAPIARDVVVFDNRVVVWNIQEIGAASRYVTRVQWSVGGDPEDWNVASIGAGYEDIVDMRGAGTRVFTSDDEILLASDRELWRGRRVGLPYVFSFSPITRTRGIPYPKAALQTPFGIVWLGEDYHIYQYAGGQLEVLDGAIHDELRRIIKFPERAFFSYDPKLLRLSFFCCRQDPNAATYPTSCYCYHIPERVWTYQKLGAGGIGGAVYQWATAVPLQRIDPRATTTWQDLTGTLGAQTATYADLLYASQASTGADGRPEEVLIAARRSGGGASIGTGTPCYFDQRSLQSEVGQTYPDSLYWGAHFGPVFTGEALREQKYVQEVRLDFESNNSSDISVYLLEDAGLGSSSACSALVSLSDATSSSSNPIQSSWVTFDSRGTYFRLKLTNGRTGGDRGSAWKFVRYYVRGETEGRP